MVQKLLHIFCVSIRKKGALIFRDFPGYLPFPLFEHGSSGKPTILECGRMSADFFFLEHWRPGDRRVLGDLDVKKAGNRLYGINVQGWSMFGLTTIANGSNERSGCA